VGTLFTAFREAAERHPDAVAIEVHDDVLTYRELLDRAERLATGIVDAVGDAPRTVGLLATRTITGFAGYLAVLRLGATVVPLNPAFPAARSRLMATSSTVDAILVDEAGAKVLEEVVRDTGIIPVLPPADLPEPYRAPYVERTESDKVAYILFTSGSTGAPKGVPIRNRNFDVYLPFLVDHYELGPGSRVSEGFDLTFDPSVFQMFTAWASGATLVVPDADELLSPVRFVASRRITHWFSVPSVISIARRLRALRPGVMPDLRWSLFAGERLTFDQARAWKAAAPSSIIENIYGPTETTITCTGYQLPADEADWPTTSNGTVPIGNVFSYLDGVVLDDNGVAGEEGELCVRGVHRFDGYLDPAVNAGHFVAFDGTSSAPSDPPAPDDWYRTGDRVRVEGGQLVHVGRVDDQLKISGYRVELGEIEAVLRGHDAVHDAVVLALTGDNDEVVLHACYTGSRPVPDEELAELAGRRLPTYMVPWTYSYVDRFPVNGNGKVDRRGLAAARASS
jgi:amino acid adenylation domain-containing protein